MEKVAQTSVAENNPYLHRCPTPTARRAILLLLARAASPGPQMQFRIRRSGCFHRPQCGETRFAVNLMTQRSTKSAQFVHKDEPSDVTPTWRQRSRPPDPLHRERITRWLSSSRRQILTFGSASSVRGRICLEMRSTLTIALSYVARDHRCSVRPQVRLQRHSRRTRCTQQRRVRGRKRRDIERH